MAIWMVKAGYQGAAADAFRDKKRIAIGWDSLGDFPAHHDWNAFRTEVKSRLPIEYSEQRVGSAAGQLWSFIILMKVGDFVITPVKSAREVLVGKIDGDYKFDPTFAAGLPRTRSVQWFHPVKWDNLPADLRNSFTAWQTVVQPGHDFTPVIAASQSPTDAVTAITSGTQADSEGENLAELAEEAVREKLTKMGHIEFQRFVGAVFKAAGFTELYNSAGMGSDGGVDIILAKNPLGAGERIIVQVKHTGEPVSQPDLQKLLGTLKGNEYGLMVSLSGVKSTGLKYWRDNRDRLIRPMDAADLIQVLQDNYDRLQNEEKALLPLKRVFVPLELDEEG